MSDLDAWDRIAPEYAAHAHGDAHGDVSVVRYGGALPGESELRLLGAVKAKRVLDLGCGPGRNAVALARQGAHVVGIDAAPRMIALARELAAEHDVRVEWRVGDLVELAWLRAGSIDLALSTGVLEHVDDLDRVLRQVHRVLRTNGPFVFTHPHPFALCATREIDGDGTLPLGLYQVRRSYFDESPIVVDHDGEQLAVYPRSVNAIVGALSRAGFSLDMLLEPEPVGSVTAPMLPRSLVIKARKLGN